jgi:hypothetical protein
MPRKSSFLMGFETGSDLYSKHAQLKLQKDAADMRKQKFEEDMKEALYRREQRGIETANLKKSTAAFVVWTGAIKEIDLDSGKDSEAWRKYNDAADTALANGIGLNPGVLEQYTNARAGLTERYALMRRAKAKGNAVAQDSVIEDANLKQFTTDAGWVTNLNSSMGTSFDPTPESIEKARTLNASIKTFELKLSKGLIDRDDYELLDFASRFPGNAEKLNRVFDNAEIVYAGTVKAQETAQALSERKARFGQTITQQNVTHAAIEKRMTEKEARLYGMLPDDRKKEILKLYQYARTNKVVAESIDGNLKYNQLKNVVNRAETIKTGPADIAIIQQFMKTLDPRSAVLQGEQESAQAAGGLMQKVLKSVDKLKSGQFLSQDMREDFLSVARWANNASIAAGRAGVNQYSKQTEDVLGVRHEFQSIRDEIGHGDWVYTNKGLYETAIRQGSLHDGDSFSYPDPDTPGGLIEGTYSAPVEQPESPATPAPSVPEGAVYESMDQVNKARRDGTIKPGDLYFIKGPDGTVLQLYATEDGKPPTGEDKESPEPVAPPSASAPHIPRDPVAQRAMEDHQGRLEEYARDQEALRREGAEAPVIQKPSVSSLGEVPPAPAPDDVGGMEGLKRGFVDLFKEETPPASAPEESSEARKLWEKDKLPENPGPDDNVLGLSYVGKTITVRGEKFTVLEGGRNGVLVKDAEGNEYYISNNELPKETAPPVPKDK